MEKRMSQGVDLFEDVVNAYAKKTEYLMLKTFTLAILSGMFIGIGAFASSIAAYSVENSSLSKLMAGIVFPVGLLLVVMIGTDLFTGNTMTLMGVFDNKIKLSKACKNLLIVFIGNLVGAVFIGILVYNSGTFNTNAALIDYVFKVASNKMSLTPVNIFFSGIGCNILVCGTIIMAIAAKDIAGKAIVSYIGILVFVVTGFEHCIANMYYFTIALLCKGNAAISALTTHPEKLEHISFLKGIYNLIFSTAGNIVGGGILLGGMLYLAYRKFGVHDTNINTKKSKFDKIA